MSYIRSHPATDSPLYQSVIDAVADPPRTTAVVEAVPQPIDATPRSLWQAIASTLRTWQARRRARCDLAEVDARSLRELGFSPELVAYELRRPFWRPLRDWRS